MKQRNTGAVIIAAGLSSRMGAFKPLLKWGGSTVIETVVNKMLDAGVAEITVVTGHQADLVKERLASFPVRIVCNPDYATTGMFESAIAGIKTLLTGCEKILFTPADIPGFQAETVRTLLNTESELACPVYNGKKGHPLLLSRNAAECLVRDSGEDGLRGAIKRSGLQMVFVPVDDPGILYDLDTPEDYQAASKLFGQKSCI